MARVEIARRVLAAVFLLVLAGPVCANTEKTIFLGPKPVNVGLSHPTLSNLRLDTLTTLTPDNGTIRTQLSAQFPSAEQPSGAATWLILDRLTPNQRYEVRVCWPASQPTEFTLETFPLSTVRDSPELMASLHHYTTSRQLESIPASKRSSSSSSSNSSTGEREASILLLRVLAAADYFTTDASLMSSVPPVDVDIILDPFLLNVLPRSLAGTACYIAVLAVAAYFLSRRIVSWMQELIASDATRQEIVQKKTQ
ncbi:a97afc63-925f-4fea-8850-79924f5c7152 [Thermothielavioides terrestris]|uniref:A97afc63-925f-4fea-8850-79924f5c7152 n=1 Tax=Thermothielavioides terrestris TaxID=2587410 RepID=A0A3S4DAV6_9PEZI|nr:a97afc63-925f-4fea-8850-79924f5c7152 [Thermothielavioides terrestris]